jgi:hypothetical protein
VSLDPCTFCREPRSMYGCAPGRCLNPRPRPTMAHAAPSPAPPAANTPLGVRRQEEAPRAPKGPSRLVLAAELRDGPNGGAYWLLELECGHTLFRYAGRAAKRRRTAPSREQCLAPDCGRSILVACAGRCGNTGDLAARLAGWAWCKRAWWCPRCFPVVLGWTAEVMGPGQRGARRSKGDRCR